MANRLDAFGGFALVGDVGDKGGGGFQPGPPARFVDDGGPSVVHAPQRCMPSRMLLTKLILGRFDRDDGRGEVLVCGCRGPIPSMSAALFADGWEVARR